VPDVQDFDYFIGVAVDNDVGRADKFAGFFHLSRSAQAGEDRQLFNAVDNRLGDFLCSGWVVFLEARNSGFELVGRFWRPPNQPHK